MRTRHGAADFCGDGGGPSQRRIPSPNVVLSIDRRDEVDLDVGASPAEASRRTRSLADRYDARNSCGGGVAQVSRRGAPPADRDANFFFYNPEWSVGSAGDAVSGMSPIPLAPSLSLSDAVDAGERPARPHRDPHHHHHRSYEKRSDRAVGKSHAALDHKPSTEFTPRMAHSTAHDLKQLLRRYQAYVDSELTPQLAQLRHALAQREEECDRLRADNAILAEQLARHTAAAAQADAPHATTRSPSPASSASPVRHAAVEERLREAGAEIALLRRQLREVRHTASSTSPPPLLAASSPHMATSHTPPDTGAPAYAAGRASPPAASAAAVAELAAVCRSMTDDCLGFTEAHADAMERHGAWSPSATAAAAAAAAPTPKGRLKGTTTASARANPFRSAVEQWRRVAGLLHGLPKAAHGSPGLAASSPAAGAPSYVTYLRAVAAALQHEHVAVAACVEALQQRAAQCEKSSAFHQRLVEDVRREAEQRMTELEADHDSEVQTLEDAIAELEQQVRMTTASRRPWTAGLMVRRATELRLASSFSSTSPILRHSAAHSPSRAEGGDQHDDRAAGTAPPSGTALSHGAAAVAVSRVESTTQTDLSLEHIRAALRKAREEPARPLRREREAELVELMLAEIERLRLRLTDSRAMTARLREHQNHFLGDVTVPLSYFDGTSAAPFSALA